MTQIWKTHYSLELRKKKCSKYELELQTKLLPSSSRNNSLFKIDNLLLSSYPINTALRTNNDVDEWHHRINLTEEPKNSCLFFLYVLIILLYKKSTTISKFSTRWLLREKHKDHHTTVVLKLHQPFLFEAMAILFSKRKLRKIPLKSALWLIWFKLVKILQTL